MDAARGEFRQPAVRIKIKGEFLPPDDLLFVDEVGCVCEGMCVCVCVCDMRGEVPHSPRVSEEKQIV